MNQTVKSPLIDTILRIVVLFLLIAWCIGIIVPFLEPVIWGAIIAVAMHPFFAMVKRWVGNRNMLAGVLLTLLILVILLLPTALVIKSLVEGIQTLVIKFRNQTLVIPPPDPSVAGWPLIGKPISEIWLLASQSLESVITTYREPLSKLGMTFLGPLGGFGKSLVMFFISVIIAGVFNVAYWYQLDREKKSIDTQMRQAEQKNRELADIKAPGGVNGSFGQIVIQPVFKPETNTSFEIGSKNLFANRQLRLNASAFYAIHKNFQYIQTDPFPFDGGTMKSDDATQEALAGFLQAEGYRVAAVAPDPAQGIRPPCELVPISLAPTLVGLTGRVYFAGVLVLGLGFLALAVQFARRRTNVTARRLFVGSIAYLPLLWALMLGNH